MALGLFCMLGAAGLSLLVPARPGQAKSVSFVVARGEGIREIAGGLHAQGLIKSRIGFTIYGLITGTATGFKPGRYSLSSAMPVPAIARTLEAGIPAITVTIREGETIVDIDRNLAKKGVTEEGEIIAYAAQASPSLEGFLFPDTYTFSGGTPAESVVAEMRENFDRNIGPLTAGMGEKERYKALILASLVEKEALYPHDRLMASGVFANRLAIGMPLQLDAANVYAKCAGAYFTCPSSERELTKADLSAEGPYNLYLHQGLPPTPIANPGRDAFIAALHPARTADLYYISNPKTGRLIFAETLDGHNENRGKYHIN